MRVVLADEHPIVGASAQILEQVRHLLEDLAPDILLIDMTLASSSGAPLPQYTQDTAASPQVFVLRGLGNRAFVYGLLLRETAPATTEHDALQTITTAMQAGLANEGSDLSQGMLVQLPAQQSKAAAPTLDLSIRECDILLLLTAGSSDQEIGAALGISKATVRYHLQKLYAKLGVRGRSEASAYAVRAGLGAEPGQRAIELSGANPPDRS